LIPEGRHRATRLAYAVAVFLSAGLLFLVEPMVGKMVVPILGGTPAVWTTCLLFFQVGLLAGYLYAHLLPARLGVRRQVWLHVGLLVLAAATLPVALPTGSLPEPDQSPIRWLLPALVGTVGTPFVLVAATAPLLQRWFSQLDHPDAADPYFLYAASNLGSFAGLLAYPFVVEPWFAMPVQRTGWTAAYVALIAAIAVAALLALRQPVQSSSDPAPDPPADRGELRVSPWRWLLLAAVPSSLLLAVTTRVSTDIAAVPLLWVLPLALYLLSFVATFARRPWVPPRIAERWLPLLLLETVAAALSGGGPVWVTLSLNYALLFIAGLLCHGELARLRPPAGRLTEFYLWVALGGALGGGFNALLAPVLFSSVAEYPLAIAAVAALARWRPLLAGPAGIATIGLAIAALAVVIGHTTVGLEILGFAPHLPRAVSFSIAIVVAAMVGALLLRRRRFHLLLQVGLPLALAVYWSVVSRRPGVRFTARDFFGVYRVQDSPDGRSRSLYHGTTIHGVQSTTPELRRRASSYYNPEGPLGDVFLRAAPAHPGRRVGVVGLGAGTTAAYAGPKESWTFYEIDPLVERIARDTAYFTYLADARTPPRVVLGDARLSLADDSSARFDLLVVDAFSSDAPPAHLLTREAVRLYFGRLAPGGLVLLDLSNRYLNFVPVVAALAADAGLVARVRDHDPTPAEARLGDAGSVWAVLARKGGDLGRIAQDPRWKPPAGAAGALWTDDFSNVVRRLR
jgi:SAM-dependent methyltransferase